MGNSPPDPVAALEPPGAVTKTFQDWHKHFEALATSTNLALLSSLRNRYPGWNVTVTPSNSSYLLEYASAGHATAASKEKGEVKSNITFGKYDYSWNGHALVIYNAKFSENHSSVDNLYILTQAEGSTADSSASTVSPEFVDELITAASMWHADARDAILVFDQQRWRHDTELFKAVKSASWDDVILEKDTKDALIYDVETFFDCEDEYKRYVVPWKRGIIIHGTPGNGKTISIKALMHSLATLKDPIPSLYVKSLAGCNNAFHAIRQIFTTARQYSPCLLIFEDLDSLIDDKVKSFFLNEVDGLEDNNGLMMLGSTNYLERLDAGISKRPGRFDRKYHFALPATPQRVAYCDYWRHKLTSKDNDLTLPEGLSQQIAEITEDFSFAYIKEVFVTSLLTIVGARSGKRNSIMEDLEEANGDNTADDEFDSILLWRVIKRQVATLRVEMEGARKSAEQAVAPAAPAAPKGAKG